MDSFDPQGYIALERDRAYVTGSSDQFDYDYGNHPQHNHKAWGWSTNKAYDVINFLLRDFAKNWRKDNTPPESRNRLFYAERLASLFSCVERAASKAPEFPPEEYDRLYNTAAFYEELVAILKGEKPYEHYEDELLCKWGAHYWHRANLPDDFVMLDGKPACSMKWKTDCFNS